MALNACTGKINTLIFYLCKLEKKEQIKFKGNRKNSYENGKSIKFKT